MAKLTVSSIYRFLEGFDNLQIHVGIDVHKRSYSVAILRPDGVLFDWTTPASPRAVTDTLLSLPCPIGMVVYEAGPTGFELARTLEYSGIPVTVAAPSRIPRPVSPTNKTDSLDCRKLAEYAATGLLRPIAIPTKQEEAFRLLVRRRHQVTDSIRRVKQRIKGLLLSYGYPEPTALIRWSKSSIAILKQIRLEPDAQETLHSQLRELEYQINEQRLIDLKVKEACVRNGSIGRVETLKAISGVGDVVAHSFGAEIFSPERFNNSGEVTSYLGLAPVFRQSGEKQDKGRLRPVGQKRLRSLLVEAISSGTDLN